MEGNNFDQNAGTNFSLGKAAGGVGQKGPQKASKVAEQRMQETFNTSTGKDSEQLKRKREEYLVKMRKQKKEDTIKGKRANVNNTITQLGDGSHAQLQLRDPHNAASDQNSTQNGENLLKITIENALEAAKTVPYQEFVSMAQRMAFQTTDFPKLVALIGSNDEISQILATIGFRRLLSSEKNPPIQMVIDMNLVPKFLGFLKRFESPKLQFEAAWCITNLASGNNDQVQVLLEKGAVEILIELLKSQNFDVIEQAIWGLGNIAGENYKVRDMVIAQRAVEPIAQILDNAQPGTSLVRNASWALSNFCRGRPSPDFDQIKRAVPSLSKVMLENDNEDILTDVSWAMSYLSDGGEERLPVILSCNCLPRMVQLLSHHNIAISVPCLRTIGNVVTGDDDQTQFAINCGALHALSNLIYHKKKTVRKEVCWTLSNITAGNDQQVQMCIDLGVIDKLLYLLINDENEIKKEAVWAVSNSTSQALPNQFFYLVQKGILKGLCTVLTFNEPRVLAVALEGIDNVLKMGKEHFMQNGENSFALVFESEGGLDKLEHLQMHPNHQIYDRVVRILEDYYSEENGDVDVGQATGESDNGLVFKF